MLAGPCKSSFDSAYPHQRTDERISWGKEASVTEYCEAAVNA